MSRPPLLHNPYGSKKSGNEKRITTCVATDVSKDASALVIAASDKAGMEGIDRNAIDAIILKESGNSLFMKQQRRRDEKVNSRIEALRQKLSTKEKSPWREKRQREIDCEIPAWIASRSRRSTKVVVDMDAFYMSCELLSRPDITEDMPACVGGSSMLMTSNYAARRYGVRAAMPGYIAEQLVRQLSGGKERLVFCKSNFDLYKEKAAIVRQVLSDFDPDLSAYSLDEAYLDLAPYISCQLEHPDWTHEHVVEALSKPRQIPHSKDEQKAILDIKLSHNASDRICPSDILLAYSPDVCMAHAERVVLDMRQRVRKATNGLTCSAGLASNFLIAKIASDRNKPNGQLAIASDHDSVTKFLHPLPIRKVCGIGRVTEKILGAFGVNTVRQLYEERAMVSVLFQETSSSASFLLKAAVGCSSSDGKVSEETASSGQQKGISRERTMQAGKSWAEVNSKLEDIANLLSLDMKQKNLRAHTVTLKVKLHTFDCISRARTMPRGKYVYEAKDLVKVATDLLQEIRNKEVNENNKGTKSAESRKLFSIRLLGIRCSNMQEGNKKDGQTTIDRFLQPDAKRDERSGSRTPSPCPPTAKVAVKRPVVQNPYSPQPQRDQTTIVSSPFEKENRTSAEKECPNRINLKDCASSEVVSNLLAGDKPADRVGLECPVCGRTVKGRSDEDTNAALNAHMDSCLNGSMVRQTVREESSRMKQQSRKRSRLTDFFSSNGDDEPHR